MIETTPKSPELMQAQVAAFTAERVDHFENKGHMFNNIGALAAGGVEDVTRVAPTNEYHKDNDGSTVKIPAGSEIMTATAQDYTDFLRSVGGARYEGIKGRADLLKNYDHFATAVDEFKASLSSPSTRAEHPAYLGSGSNSTVFSIHDGDKDYAVRVPNRSEGVNPGAIDSHMAGAVLGKGMPHMEQIVAASYDKGVTIAEIMPGKEVSNLVLEDVKHVTDDQLGELADTLITANQRGIEIDPKPSNFFYDTEAGYGIVDYHAGQAGTSKQTVGTVVGWAATAINNTGFYAKSNGSVKSTEDYARDLELHKANLDVMQRYRTIVADKLTGESRIEALEFIDTRLQEGQETVQKYADPQYIADLIARETQWHEQKAARAAKTENGDNGWGTA